MTDKPIIECERAVRLWDNHRLLEQEYIDLQTMLSKMQSVMDFNSNQSIDFSIAEERLGISFPEELKLVYKCIMGHEEYFNCDEHFLPLDEIYIDLGYSSRRG